MMTFLSMMVLCFALGWPALARAQGNPWNNPVVSPRVGTGGEVTFSVSVPSASRVELSGQFMDGTCPMRKGTDGVWSVTVKIGRPDIYPYSFRIDGVEVSDPSNPLAFPNERFKASLLEMPDTAALYARHKDVPRGQVRYCSYYSEVLQTDRTMLVYTPPGYDREAGRRYPVLYLVSGTTDTEETWYKVGRVDAILDNLIARGEAEPMLVVMPYGYMPSHGTPMPSSPEAAEMYATFARELTEAVIPYVESEFRTELSRESRAVGGFSRGGGQALFAAFSHPELFAHVASYSAYLTPQVMDRHFGRLMEEPARMDSLYRVKWFGVGRGDFLYADVMRHLDYFREKGISCRTCITDGGHTWMNARAYLAETLRLFFRSSES
ncbi:MAG TPA: esterase [Paraprevotella xylaniphila]|nr:esterase [Paraprevotella xylaniphila]